MPFCQTKYLIFIKFFDWFSKFLRIVNEIVLRLLDSNILMNKSLYKVQASLQNLVPWLRSNDKQKYVIYLTYFLLVSNLNFKTLSRAMYKYRILTSCLNNCWQSSFQIGRYFCPLYSQPCYYINLSSAEVVLAVFLTYLTSL